MKQKALELILMRQLAGYLAMPILLFDEEGNMLYQNEQAALLIGRRFDDAGELPLKDWCEKFDILGEDGLPIPMQDRLIVKVMREQRPEHATFWLRTDGSLRKLEATAIPLKGQGGRHLGVVGIIWEPTNE